MKAYFVYEKFTEDSDPIKDMGIGIHTGWRLKYDKKPFLTYIFYLYDSMDNKKYYRCSLFYEKRHDRKGNQEDAVWFGNERLVGGWEAYGGTPLHLSNMQNKPERFFSGGSEEATFWVDKKRFDIDMIDPMATKDKETISKMMNELSKEWFEESDFIRMMKSWIRTGVCRVDHVKLRCN